MTITTTDHALADVQAELDTRGIALDRVGITGLDYPIRIRQKDGGEQTVAARLDLTVGLHAQQRGAHLSSLVEALHERREQLRGLDDVVRFTRDIRLRQDRRGLPFDTADVRVRFKYFLSKPAPATGRAAFMAYECGYRVSLGRKHGSATDTKSTIARVPITTLCPCGREVANAGAHNQRAVVTIQLQQELDDRHAVWFEDLIAIAEECGSAPVYSLLKRADEKVVTEAMFNAPRFAEDVVRNAVLYLHREYGGVHYTVRCESLESIHNHSAIAEVTSAS